MTLPTPQDGTPQSVAPGQAPAPTPPATGQPPEPTPQQTPTDMFPREYVEQLRQEAAQRRQENKDLKAQLDGIQTLLQTKLGINPAAPSDEVQTALGQLSDLQKKFEQSQEKNRESDKRAAVIAEAARVGFADPIDAYTLIDKTKIDLKDDGTVTGVDEAVKALADAKPYLLKAQGQPQQPRVGATNPAGAAPGGPPQWAVDMFRPGMGTSIGDAGVIYSGND